MSTLPNCDKCGRFVLPGSPGSSWVNVPSTDANFGDERERCAPCTERHGPALCSPSYRRDLCCGVIPRDGGASPPPVAAAVQPSIIPEQTYTHADVQRLLDGIEKDAKRYGLELVFHIQGGMGLRAASNPPHVQAMLDALDAGIVSQTQDGNQESPA